jgi:hypothetical protein
MWLTRKSNVFRLSEKSLDELWDEIRLIFPAEKTNKIIGRPVVLFRKVSDSILNVLRTGCHSGRCYQNNMALVLLHVIGDFRNDQYLRYSKNYGLGYYKSKHKILTEITN